MDATTTTTTTTTATPTPTATPTTPSSGKRRNRSRSKEAAAPNLNGNKEAARAPDAEPEGAAGAASPRHGRKRKAGEMRRSESSGEDAGGASSPEKEAREGGEPEHKADSHDEQMDETPSHLTEEKQPADDMSVPQKQQLGKGKRARIPNKRYSDILITSPKHEKHQKQRIENGENQQQQQQQQAPDVSEKENSLIDRSDSGSPALKASRASTGSPSGHSSKKQKVQVDLTNPNYLKPFQFGWKRELVYRATSDSAIKRNGDIYYYTPSGKKVRSMREVSENLKNKELTLDDFTFYKEPLGIDDPEKEIIRDAKLKTGPREVVPKAPRTPRSGSPKPSTPTTGTPTVEPAPQKVNSPKPTSSGFKVKFPNKNQSAKAKTEKKNKDDVELSMRSYPSSNWSGTGKKSASSTSSKWGNMNEEDKRQPCSIRCDNVKKPIPSLQCRLCLCLFHNECVGLSPNAIIQAYVCKTCQLRQQLLPSTGPAAAAAILPPPPLTPISAMKSSSGGAAAAGGTASGPAPPPKLQRMPKPEHPVASAAAVVSEASPNDTLKPEIEMPKLTPRPGLCAAPPPPPQTPPIVMVPEPPPAIEAAVKPATSLLGSVTTWFPPSSTIQVGDSDGLNRRADDAGALRGLPRPQVVEYLGRKKFLIVPKHNVLSVSPPEELVSVPIEAARIPETPPEVKQEPVSEPEAEAEARSTPTLRSTPKSALKSKRIKSLDEESIVIKCTEKNYMQNLAYGYGTLLYVFQYLKVQDLLRAGCVCTMWRDVASHPVLWRTVRMKNSQVHSFQGLTDTLQKHGTVHLDLRKMLLTNNEKDELWPQFSESIGKVETLRKIELCRCPSRVIECLAASNPKLEVLNALAIKSDTLSLEPLAKMENLIELKVKATNGLVLTSDLNALESLGNLKSLSLTSIKDLQTLNLEVIAELANLESLELGECIDLPITFGSTILSKLQKLEKLRLEKGQGTCYTFEILEAVRNMPRLEQLELVNFDIKTGFDKALGDCTNLKKLMIIPTYVSQSATTNHMVLGGVLRLQSTLSHFVWGVTLELLRVTELFVDQCEDNNEKKEKKEKKPVGNGDSIPVLKPVPFLEGNSEPPPQTSEPPQVEILPLPNLQKLLLANLPSTRVKILKIPFHATWRQTLSDSAS